MQAILLYTVMATAVLLDVRGATRGGVGADKALAQRHKEDVMLVAAGFEPEDECGDFWRRDKVSYGREAALQCAWREWRKR